MSLLQLVSYLEQIENGVSVLCGHEFDGMEDHAVSWVVGPQDPSGVNSICAWFEITRADLTREVLQALFQVFAERKLQGWQSASSVSSISTRLEAVAKSLQEGSETWNRICEARQEICLNMEKGGLNKEEFWRFRAFTERAKELLLRQVASARINLQEIGNLVEYAKNGNDSYRQWDITCPITGQHCDLPIDPAPRQVFVGFQFVSNHYRAPSLKVVITEALQKLNLTPFFPDENFEPVHISCEICRALQRGSICIFEISDSNPNVMFELGLAYMLGKCAILLAKKGSPGTQMADIAGIRRIEYDDLVQCRDSITRYLKGSSALSRISDTLGKDGE